MSFPYHDRLWSGVADFIAARARPGESILAPDIFWYRLPRIYRYPNTFLHPDADYDWAIVHKGELGFLSRRVLERVVAGRAVFANDVFVIWQREGDCAPLSDDDAHLRTFRERLAACIGDGIPQPPPSTGAPLLPDPGAITSFRTLSEREIEHAMDMLWTKGGYAYETVRDRVHSAELDRYVGEFLGDSADRDLLDLCCGDGRLKGISDTARVTGVDISSVAVQRARERHAERANFRFERMSAEALGFPDDSFDDVVLIEAIEHVRDLGAVFAEVARVMRKGGRFLLTGANRDSLNQVLLRRLGTPGFLSTFQHIREYGYAEVTALLQETGFSVLKTAGISLFPYWGVPGVDQHVRDVTDNDPVFVEWMRRLGERVGAEYAYSSVVLAERV